MEEIEYLIEILVFIASAIYTVVFFVRWYKPLSNTWPMKRSVPANIVLSILPVFAFLLLIFVLTAFADMYVVDDFFYILFYIFLGYVWISAGMYFMHYFFGLDWRLDALHGANLSALFTITCSFVGILTIYSGANVGDGPGWWCVVFAGALGTLAFFLTGRLHHLFTESFERVSSDRSLTGGIRTGGYLLGISIILARASSGDWTSFGMTALEFLDCWPILPLTAFAVIVELIYKKNAFEHTPNTNLSVSENNEINIGSIIFALSYMALAALCVIFIPRIPWAETGLVSVAGSLL